MTENNLHTDLWQRFSQTTAQFPSHVALKYQVGRNWQTLTYHELHQHIQQIQQQLQAYGFAVGERVILFPQNDPQTIIYFFALLALQATPILLDDQLPQQQLAELIEFCDARVIIGKLKSLLEIPGHTLTHKMVFEPKDVPTLQTGYAATLAQQPATVFNANIALMLFTSGTTGRYQAACHTHASILASIDANIQFSNVDQQDRTLAFLPLFHIYPLVNNLLAGLYAGTEVTLLSRLDSLSLLAAMQESRPTVLIVVPRLLEVLYQQLCQHINKRSRIANLIIVMLCYATQTSKFLRLPFLQQLLTQRFRKLFGGHVKCFFVGGAKLERKVQWIFDTLVAPVYLGYGLTETAGAAIVCHQHQAKLGSVGRASNYCQLRLENCDASGQGEICLQTSGLMQGYFRNDQAITQGGWFHTGDLGFIDKKGFLTITGRIKELIVLSDGKKVLPGIVESYYQHIAGVAELIVIGLNEEKATTHEKVCALVVKQPGRTLETVQDEEKRITTDIQNIAIKLPFHYHIKEVYFVDKIIKTNTLKVNRPANRAALLAKLSQTPHHNHRIDNAKHAVEFGSAEKIILQKLVNILEETLNVTFSRDLLDKNLLELGIDSLAFANFYVRIMLDFPDAVVSSSALEQLKLKELVKRLALPTTDIKQKPAWIDTKLDPAILVDQQLQPATNSFANVLLTGASGFLGAYLLSDLLNMTSATVFCLVRAKDAVEGMQRIIENLTKYQVWQSQFKQRIVVVPADIAQTNLGLDADTYQHLASAIDVIIHAAAWVNFLADFSTLAPTNVTGTESLIRFATQVRLKPIEYVSTYSVLLSTHYEKSAPEQAALYPPDIDLGYTQSKWVAEQLLTQAAQQGLPVNIHRPGNITGNTLTGDYNKNDFVTNLLVSCLQLGKFIKNKLQLDLTPVNYVSKAIVYAALQQQYGGFYHLVNPTPIRFSQIIKFFAKQKFSLQSTSEAEWILSVFGNSACVIYAYLPLLLKRRGKGFFYSMMRKKYTKIETFRTELKLRQAGIICPPSDDKLLKRYLDKFIEHYPDIKRQSL